MVLLKKNSFILIAGFTVKLILFFGNAIIDKEWGAMLFNLENNQVLNSNRFGHPVPISLCHRLRIFSLFNKNNFV